MSAEDIHQELHFESSQDAVYHRQAVTFSPKDYAQRLVEEGLFKLRLNCELADFEKRDEHWQLHFKNGDTEGFDTIVLATAYATKKFSGLNHLPLRVTRGQVAYLKKDQVQQEVETGLNFVNYLVQEKDEKYILGATFQVDDFDATYRPEENIELINSVERFFPGLLKDVEPTSLEGRVCFRAVLKDYFPLVGPVCDLDEFERQFAALKYGRPHHQYPKPAYRDGLYVLAGLGARGLSTASLMGSYLARMIVDGIGILPETHIGAIHPSRFIVKELKKS